MKRPPLKSSPSLVLMFIASFLLCIFFGAISIQIGAPGNYINIMMLSLLVGGYIFAGIFGKTMQLCPFQTTERSGTPLFMGQSLAAGVISSGIFIFLAGQFYETGTDALAIFTGIILGIALMTILFSAAINRSQAPTLASFILPGDTRRISRLIILLIVLVCSLLLVHVQFSTIGLITETFFGMSQQTGIILTAVSIMFCLLLGGLQSLSIIRMMIYPLLAICFLAPIAWTAFKITGSPIPQLAFGTGALEAIREIDQEMIDAGLAQKTDIFQITNDGLSLDVFNHISVMFCVAFGIAAMPHLLQHFTTLSKAENARKTGVWGLGFVLLILTAIPAVTVFFKLDLYTTLLGLQLSEFEQEAEWLFALSGHGALPVITICGQFITSAQDAITACNQPADYFLLAKDIGVRTDMFLLASGILNELPDLMTSFLAVGALMAIWSTADGLFFVLANTIVHDGYHCIIRPKSPLGTRLFMTRLFLILMIGLSTYLALNWKADIQFVFAASLALGTAGLFPALVFQTWIKPVTHMPVMLGTLAGFSTTACMLILSHYGQDLIVGSGDEFIFSIPMITDVIHPMSMGLIGMLVAFALTFLISGLVKLVSATRKPKSNALA